MTTRERNLAKLKKQGFRVSGGLPAEHDGKLRPAAEIAARLMALHALFVWVNASDENVASKLLKSYAKRNGLTDWMSKSERAMFLAPRKKAHVVHNDTIGWRLENMWPLAWALGYKETPPVDGEMIGQKTIQALLFDFLPGPDEDVADLLKGKKLRTTDDVSELEDLFYCCHNAVRSAQLGGKTVPKGFDPVGNGGVIHERRHALTWMLSPKVDWDDTDLST